MTGDAGGFYSTLDADSEGVEGKYFMSGHWKRFARHRGRHGKRTRELMAQHLGITVEGNWQGEGGRGGEVRMFCILLWELRNSGVEYKTTPEAMQKRLDGIFLMLRQALRASRRPGLDDKRC